MFRRCLTISSWLAVVSLLAWQPASVFSEDTLTIGSDAPKLDVEHWVSDGNGKFEPITDFAKDKVYVVEFWATWCGPCIASMPHLAELQTKYADKGVQIVSISDEELTEVETFLKREVPTAKPRGNSESKDEKDDKPGAKGKTFKELTSAYCLTTDPDRSVYADYMEAARQNGIPTAFIVGKDQKIEWIGHPMQMDEPLAQVVAGKWNREAFAEEFKERQELEILMAQLSAAARKGDTKSALKLIDEALAKTKDNSTKEQLKIARLQIQLNDKDSEDELPTILAEAYKYYARQPSLINNIAWTVAQKMEAGQLESKEVLEATRAAIEKAAKQGDGDQRAALLDTAAHIQLLAGDLDAAIKSQTTALEIASDSLKAQLQDFMDQLKKEKEKEKVSEKKSKGDKSENKKEDK